jgi:tetratricopeptide (TPR) repeat protein
LFWSLENRASGDDVVIDNDKKEITLSPASLRSGRVLAILINIYKNIGIDFTSNNLFDRGYYYLDKYFKYHNDDVLALSSMALCCFMLNDVPSAMSYTEKIGRIDKSSPFYIINKAFFGIYDKNYTSAIYFYKEILKRGMIVDPRIITGVISFLDQRYRNDRKELAYEFAIGILNKYYCQQKEGINELRKFVRKAKNIPQYQEMVIFAINNIQKPKRKRN